MITTSLASPESSSTDSKLTSRIIIIYAALAIALTAYVSTSPLYRQLLRITTTLRASLAEYPAEFDAEHIFDNAAVEMYGLLDRYSFFVPRERFSQIDEEFSGAYAGIGVTVVAVPRGLLVAGVNPDGPAHDAGILLGDIIAKADSVSFAGQTVVESTRSLRGHNDEPVALTVLRPQARSFLFINSENDKNTSPSFRADTMIVAVTRREVALNHVSYAGVTPQGSLYFRVDDFEAGLADQFRALYDSLAATVAEGAGVIVDVRGNPGGLLGEALAMSEFFLPKNTLIVGQKGRSRWSRSEHFSSGEDVTGGAPVVILVDRGSASAAEIFAGSLKYANRATLIGDTTFGKGLVQEYGRFGDGSASRLTVSRYYFTGEVYLNRANIRENDSGVGAPPDIYYSFESDDFLSYLEGELFLLQYACANQNEIADKFRLDPSDSSLATAFELFCRSSGSDYQSALVQRANALALLSELELRDLRAVTLAHEIADIALRSEKNLFQMRWRAIFQRLAELAYERRDGARLALATVRLPHDPVILTCDSVIAAIGKNAQTQAVVKK